MKDRPPSNRDPHRDEIDLYAPLLREQIEIIQPRVIVTLGRFAMDFILNAFDIVEAGKKIGELHSQVLDAEAEYGASHVVPLYHPAAAFYNPDLKTVLADDIRGLQPFLE